MMSELFTLRKNKHEIYKVNSVVFHDIEYIDIRIYYNSDGESYPTKKGVTIEKDKFFTLITGTLENFS